MVAVACYSALVYSRKQKNKQANKKQTKQQQKNMNITSLQRNEYAFKSSQSVCLKA